MSRSSDWDPYRVLDLEHGASMGQVKAAYRAHAQLNHPDRTAGMSDSAKAIAESKMRELNRALEDIEKGWMPSPGRPPAPHNAEAPPTPAPSTTIHPKKQVSLGVKALLVTIGAALVAAGGAMIILPGPGWMVVLIGAAIVTVGLRL
jgi:hypothetical protein